MITFRKNLSYLEVALFNKYLSDGPFVLISFDTESPIDSNIDNLSQALTLGMRYRIGLERILYISAEYETPFTFFCTGHALLKECNGHYLKIYINKENRKYNFKKGKEYLWHILDPKSNYITYPEFYYGDIIERILKSNIGHEIASHSFSHIPYSLVSHDIVVHDLLNTLKIFKSLSLRLLSFAFPYNLDGKFYYLNKFGIKICRIGHKGFKFITLNNGVFSVRTHITDFPSISLKFWIKIAHLLVRKKFILIWYLHPEILSEEFYYRLFNKIIRFFKMFNIEIITFKHFYNIISQ